MEFNIYFPNITLQTHTCYPAFVVLKLEKRLDDNLMYLRDALPEHSTVDTDMKPQPSSPTGEVPVNKVRGRAAGASVDTDTIHSSAV